VVFFGAITLTGIILMGLIFSSQTGFFLLLVFKPIIDASWDSGMFGFNALEVVGVGVPVIILFRMFFSKDGGVKDIPLSSIWIIYIFMNLISSSILLANGELLKFLEFFFRILNGFVGYYMFQAYVKTREDFRKLLIAFLLAGLFPMLLGVYQIATGTVWINRTTTGGLVRYTGVYHDVFSFRSYAFATITAIILYWSYFQERSFFRNTIFAGYIVICSMVIFRAYSKSGFAIATIWVLLWTILNKKFKWLFIILAVLVAVNFGMHGRFFNDISTVFSKETQAIEGTGETRFILAGRLGVWETYWDRWKQSDLFHQFFGLGTIGGSAHNDYLRTLVSGGILGLGVYLLLLGVIGWRILINLFRKNTPLNIIGLMLFLMWLVDTAGLVPSMYPSYQWLVWGFIGLIIQGIQGLDDPTEARGE